MSTTQTLLSKPTPFARKIAHKTIVHGKTLLDPYYWMRHRDDPEILAYLRAENAYTESQMASTKPLQETLYREILGRIKETDLSVPTLMGGYYYYSRTKAGKQYPILVRKKGSLDSQEETLLDLNELAKGTSYFNLGSFEISPQHNYLAYAADTTGAESYHLTIKDLKTGNLLKDQIQNCSSNVEWAEDNQTLFYTTLDSARRPHQLWRHTLGTDSGQDALLYEEKDEAFIVAVAKTKSRGFLLLNLHSKTSSEVHFLDAQCPTGTFRLFAPRKPHIEYSLAHFENRFFILTNDQAVNFKLLETPCDQPEPQAWKEVLAHRPEVKLEGIECFRNFSVLYERFQGLMNLVIWDMKTGQRHTVEQSEPVFSVWGLENPEFDSSVFRFGYTSLRTPSSVFDYDMAHHTRELKKQTEVLGGYDPLLYESKRIWAISHDATRVPISLIYRKDLFHAGENPLLLYGYGSYGISYDPEFSSARLSLLNRGFVCAIAHIRGGGDLGRPWYEHGKFLKKKNTFSDFIACAEHLVREHFVHPKKIAIYGASAGGLLIGNVLNQRPDLFHAALAKVPFVDIVQTMLDKTLPLTVGEFEEWGNPEDLDFFRYMLSYSPYDHVKAQDYPHLLITAGWNDPRVQYWEPAKWTAKLREHKTDTNLLMLKTELESGHGGPSGRYDSLREIAFDYAYLLKTFEINS